MTAFDEKLSPDDELLSVYLDGEATPAERAAVERRLASDPAARRLLDELRAASQAVRELPRGALPRRFADEVLAAVGPAAEPHATASPSAPTFADPDALPGTSGWRRGGIWASLALAAALLLMLTRPEEPLRPGPQGINAPREFDVAQAQPELRPPIAPATRSADPEATPEIAAAPDAEPFVAGRADDLDAAPSAPFTNLAADMPADAFALAEAAPATSALPMPSEEPAAADRAIAANDSEMRGGYGGVGPLSLDARAEDVAAPPENAAPVDELAFGAVPRDAADGGLGGMRGPERFQQPAAAEAFSAQLAAGDSPANFARSAPGGLGAAAAPAAAVPAAPAAAAAPADPQGWALASAEPPQQVVLRLAEGRRGDGTLERLLAEQGLDANEGMQRAAGRRALRRDRDAEQAPRRELAEGEELALVASPQQIAGLLEAVAADATLCQDIAYPEVERLAAPSAEPPPVADREPSRELPSRWYDLQQQVRQRGTRGLTTNQAGGESLQRKSSAAVANPTDDAKTNDAPREIVLQIEWVAPDALPAAGQASPKD